MNNMTAQEYVNNVAAPNELEVLWEGNWEKATRIQIDTDDNMPLLVHMECIPDGEYGDGQNVWLDNDHEVRV